MPCNWERASSGPAGLALAKEFGETEGEDARSSGKVYKDVVVPCLVNHVAFLRLQSSATQAPFSPTYLDTPVLDSGSQTGLSFLILPFTWPQLAGLHINTIQSEFIPIRPAS